MEYGLVLLLGAGEVVLALENLGQRVPRRKVLRVERYDLLESVPRLVQFVRLDVELAQLVQDGQVGGPRLESALESGDRPAPVLALPQEHALLMERSRMVGTD